MTNQIVLATGNRGKVREIQHALKHLNVEIIPQTDFAVSEVAETGLTFIENALIKARHAAKITGLAAIADDSGLVVPALKGEPGLYSARYAGEAATDQDNIQKLLTNLENIKERQAHFYSALVYLSHEKDPEPIICEGRWQGEVLSTPQGKKGFGYDPIFYVPTHQCSAAELELDEKNRISHRGQALLQLQATIASLFE